MNRKNLPVWRMFSVLLVAIMTVLAGCGGGGGEGGSTPAAAQTGTVAVFIKDGPTDQFEKILVTVTEVSLIPVSGEPVVIYQNPVGCEIDLLQYREEEFLFTIKRDVPAGTYSKVRLQVANIELVPKEESDIDIEVKLPSGKIDLNPRGTFIVIPGGNLSVRIDMDANKAIHVHPSRTGWYIFRPVVFVDIESGFPESICPKIVHGTITELKKDGNQTTGFVMSLGENRGTLVVKLNAYTDIFGADGNFVDPSALRVGQEVRVRGKVDDSGALAASLVIIGDVIDVLGDVEGAVVGGLFAFTPFTGEELVGTNYPVRVVNGKTLILAVCTGCSSCGIEVGPEAIQPGMVARVFGKIVNNVLNAVAIILQTREITGVIQSADDEGGTKLLTIRKDDNTITSVLVLQATPVYLEGDGTVSADYLTPGRRVRVLVDPASSTTPPSAKAVYIVGEKVEGSVVSINPNFMVVMDGNSVSYNVTVPADATILDLRNSGYDLARFSDIQVGDDIVFFGLSTSTPGTYEAPVVLIVD
jgi:hypothetical protein